VRAVVDGPGFVAHDLTIENTAGAANDQAVALRLSSDRSAVYRCNLNGYQDTLYADKNTQYYNGCRISGTVDFVFGDAAAVFQNCTLVARKPIQHQQNTITAHKRAKADEATGFVFQSCHVVADEELLHAGFPVETYLGRPWDAFARVVFMKCDLQGLVDPKGWLQWPQKTDIVDMYFGEYSNTGAGAGVSGRVNWPGFHVITDASEAKNFTVENFIGRIAQRRRFTSLLAVVRHI
jgi:pectinesterase